MKFYVRRVLKTTSIEVVRNKLESTGVTEASNFPTSFSKFLEISLDVSTANRVDKELKADRLVCPLLEVHWPTKGRTLLTYLYKQKISVQLQAQA